MGESGEVVCVGNGQGAAGGLQEEVELRAFNCLPYGDFTVGESHIWNTGNMTMDRVLPGCVGGGSESDSG